MTHVTCRLTTKNRDQLRNSTLGNRAWVTFYLYNIGLLSLIQSVEPVAVMPRNVILPTKLSHVCRFICRLTASGVVIIASNSYKIANVNLVCNGHQIVEIVAKHFARPA